MHSLLRHFRDQIVLAFLSSQGRMKLVLEAPPALLMARILEGEPTVPYMDFTFSYDCSPTLELDTSVAGSFALMQLAMNRQ